MELVEVEMGLLGYLLLLGLAGTLFFWLRRWLRRRWRSEAAVVIGAGLLAFGLAALAWLLVLMPLLASRLAVSGR